MYSLVLASVYNMSHGMMVNGWSTVF